MGMDANEIRESLRAPARSLRDEIPDVMRAYAELSKAASADGELSSKVKELIALAIAITRECDGCVVAHARNLARLGATRREVAEAAGVAIAMNGGPGTVWGPRALDLFDQLVAERSDSGGGEKK